MYFMTEAPNLFFIAEKTLVITAHVWEFKLKLKFCCLITVQLKDQHVLHSYCNCFHLELTCTVHR